MFSHGNPFSTKLIMVTFDWQNRCYCRCFSTL